MACGGVRNRIYESFCFGSTFVWDTDLFEVESAPVECSNPEVVRLRVLDGTGTVTVTFTEAPPDAGEPVGPHQKLFPKVGTKGPHFVDVGFEGTLDADTRDSPQEIISKSVRGPAPEWEICHATGVFELREFRSEWGAESVTIDFVFANVDDKVAYLEVSRMLLIETDASVDPPIVREIAPDQAVGNIQHIELPVDFYGKGEVPVQFTFTGVDGGKSTAVVYLRPGNRREILIGIGDVNGPGRPRINPGG